MNAEEWFDTYYLNELTQDELKEFRERLETDVAFREEFEFQENLRKSIKSRERDILKTKLQQHEEARQDGHTSGWKKWLVAASIIILIGVAGIGYFNRSGPDFDELYTQNYEVYPNTEVNITRGKNNTSLEYRAFVAYERRGYAQAIDFFLELKKGEYPKYVDFYLAQSYLATGDFEKAIAEFDMVIQDNSSFVDESNWYAALSALKLENQAVAKKHLNFLVAKDGYKTGQARAILQKLD